MRENAISQSGILYKLSVSGAPFTVFAAVPGKKKHPNTVKDTEPFFPWCDRYVYHSTEHQAPPPLKKSH